MTIWGPLSKVKDKLSLKAVFLLVCSISLRLWDNHQNCFTFYAYCIWMFLSWVSLFTANEATKHIRQIFDYSTKKKKLFFDSSQSAFWFRCSQRYSKRKVIFLQMCLFECLLVACRSDKSRFFLVCISHSTHAITHHFLWDKKYFEGGGMSSKAVSCRKFLLHNSDWS